MRRELIRRIKSLPKVTSDQWSYEEMVELLDVLREIDQLDELEVLSQEWIDEHAKAVTYDGIPDQTEVVYVDDLKELLVPKQELPVVPKHVADWLDDNIERYRTVRSFINSLVELFGDTVPEKVRAYARENIDTMARAYLDGYTVEEEPLYTARLKVITGEYVASYLRTQSVYGEKVLGIGGKDIHEAYRHLSEFTEHELKVLDIWDSDQWVVEEVEE